MKRKIKVKALEGSPYLISEEELIGRGAFGSVYKVYSKDQPEKRLAVKIMSI